MTQENQDKRPLYNIRIYEEVLTDSSGRRYRSGGIWQVKTKSKDKTEEASNEAGASS